EVGFAVETVRYFFVWTVAPLLARRLLAPAGQAAADYAVSIPPLPINRALTILSRYELALSRYVSWPLGSSLLAIARRDRIQAEIHHRGHRDHREYCIK